MRVVAWSAYSVEALVDAQVMQPALVVIANCVTVPPSLAHLLPPPDRAQGRHKAGKPERPALLITPQPSEMIADELQPASSSGVCAGLQIKSCPSCFLSHLSFF